VLRLAHLPQDPSDELLAQNLPSSAALNGPSLAHLGLWDIASSISSFGKKRMSARLKTPTLKSPTH
jgi:hypothetical protein